jgi:hypothetical protein
VSLLVTFLGTSEAPPDHVGGKTGSLIRMAAAGYRVPPGAVLTTEFFAPWFAEVHGTAAWQAFRDAAPEQWPERCAELKAVVAGLEWNTAQRRALAELEESLPRIGGERFAVRSSAPDEDLSRILATCNRFELVRTILFCPTVRAARHRATGSVSTGTLWAPPAPICKRTRESNAPSVRRESKSRSSM